MRSNRWVFVDLFRCCAVLLMLQGHVFDSFLMPSIKAEVWFYHHTFIHGFTSPIFLFASGLAFGVATFRKWDSYITWGQPIIKRFKRYGLLLAIGYWLHLAYYSLKFMFTKLTSAQYNYLFQVDALQIIAVTLLGCQAVVFHSKKVERFVFIMVTAILLISIVSPYLWGLDKSNWWLFIRAYIDKSTGSYFPIFPWAIYLLAGTLVAYLFTKWKDLPTKTVVFRLCLMGLFSFAIGKMGMEKWIMPYGTGSPLEDDATFVFLVYHNLGVILWIIAGLYYLDAHFIQPYEDVLKGNFVKKVTLIGSETLVIYIVHLFIVYGSPLNKAVLAQYRGFLNVPLAILYAICLIIFMYFFAIYWNRFKKEKPEHFKKFQYYGTALLLLLFTINNWLLSII